MTEPLTNEEEVIRATNLAAGVTKRLSAMTTIMIDNSAETPTEIEDKLMGFVRDREGVSVTKAAYEAAIAKASASQAVVVPFMGRLTAYVRATFGNATEILVDFGIAPLKARTPLTAEEKVAANAKREATRKARGVMGSARATPESTRGRRSGGQITPVTEPATAPMAPLAAPQGCSRGAGEVAGA